MKKLNQLLEALNSNQNVAYSLIRSFLGIALFIRGWIFISNPDAIMELVKDNSYHMWYSYVTIGHLLGGLFMAAGIFTRVGSFIQIPILIGALFVLQDQTLVKEGQSMELVVMVLFVLMVCFVFGSGAWSLGKRFKFTNL
jgi:uncharacterized membrane protein YphA (DoxX/SURF4 family)